MRATLIKTHQLAPEIRVADVRRDWMDDTYNKHAYRCLPLTEANTSGWEIILQRDITVIWEGGHSVPKIIDGDMYDSRSVANCNKVGLIDFHIGYVFGTDDGYSTWLSGPPNFFIDGAVPLAASIPSYWWPDEVQFNWKITKINEPVIFPAGMPFTFFQFYDNRVMPSVEFSVERLWEKPELMQSRYEYGQAKMRKVQEEPWTWMNGIRTGVDHMGNVIGPRFEGHPTLEAPLWKE